MRSSQLEQIKDPQVALSMLKEGNQRFVEGKQQNQDRSGDRTETIESQKPFAIVLTCADSRCSPEAYFDAKIGDLFVLRNAGNFATDVELGSMEFATAVLGAAVCVVVGHSNCGAVFNSHGRTPNLPEKLQYVLDNIYPGIKECATKEDALHANVDVVVNNVKANPVIQGQGTLVVGALYDFHTGKVTFTE
ncbi:MAG: hypothetical protein FWD98_06995 [Defluviitaleaceae bacterium]|nr:hypothetical protein [Defluviitaleaceae bacterium]